MPTKRKEVDPKDYKKVMMWAAQGLGVVQIARKLGMSDKCFRDRLGDTEELRDAYNLGKSEEESRLVATLSLQASNPDHPKSTVAAIFLLKSRHQYSDQPAPAPALSVTNNVLQLKFPKPVAATDLPKLAAALAPGAAHADPPAIAHETPANKGGPPPVVIDGHVLFEGKRK